MKRIAKAIFAGVILVGALEVFADNPILKNTEPGFLYATDSAAEVFDGKVYVYCSRDVNVGRFFLRSSCFDKMTLQ